MKKIRVIIIVVIIGLYQGLKYYFTDNITKSNYHEYCIGDVMSVEKNYNRENYVYITFKDINEKKLKCKILSKNVVSNNNNITNKKLYAYINLHNKDEKIVINEILMTLHKTNTFHADNMDDELIIK